MRIFKVITEEVRSYLEDTQEIFEGYEFSQYRLVKRIVYYQNQIYPKGKLDSHGNYKYWFDVISPRIDSEIKNVDFDRSNIEVYSRSYADGAKVLLANAYLKDWMKTTGQGEKINEAVENGTGWGNVVWKKVKGDYEIVDLKNFFVVNQTAKKLCDTPVIERHLLTQSDLRAKKGIWKNVEDVIKTCGDREFSATNLANNKTTENPYYEIFERNGEISEKDLYEAQGKSGGSDDKYVLAKIVVAGLNRGASKKEKEVKYILYADVIPEMPYKEYHRGRYQGRWFRLGMYELLMDIQTRANEIGNQIAKGLEWSSKTIFRSSDKLIAQNVLNDLTSGDIIRSIDVQQVPVRMQGLDQLIADWNRLMEMADRLANSYEVVTGESLPAGTPFRLGAMMNQNANKLFDFIREKLAMSLENLIEEWILPYLLRDLKLEKVLRVTGDDEWLGKYYELVVNSWYTRNLVAMGPHSPELAQLVKEKKLEELTTKKEAIVSLSKDFWKEFKPRAKVVITGEKVSQLAELETLSNFINLEADPVRRTALIEMAMQRKGIDISKLPKTTPEQMAEIAGRSPQGQQQQQAPSTMPVTT
jgi:hypothetical protein